MYRYLILLFTIILFEGCKTKQVNTDSSNLNQVETLDYSATMDFLNRNQNTNQLSQSEINSFVEAFTKLNVQYEGKSIEDKLNVLLAKTEQGTQMTLSGTGKVSYYDQNELFLSDLRKDLLTHKDSITLIQSAWFEGLKKELQEQLNTKTKQTNNVSFTFFTWIIIGLAFISGTLFNRVLNLFKKPLKNS